ncbi:MAG: DUF4190 domain-containing protein [Fuerstiella sp.]
MADRNYQNPFENTSRQTSYRSAVYAQKTSALAILSVIAGLLSYPMMCLCFLSIPFSIFAIVCGHMSRGIVRDSDGEYSGLEMATFGMLLGYISLVLMGTFLLYSIGGRDVPIPATPTSVTVTPQAEGDVLLKQAEGQLLAETETAAIGVSTTDQDAVRLAEHYIETLHVLDATHFAETNPGAATTPRAYRVFVQLNDDSIAFLVQVPELSRFTPAAVQTLQERCWLIAQRSVDELLPEGRKLAVALYSATGVESVMIGVTVRSSTADAGLQNTDATPGELATFFRLPDLPTSRLNDATPPIDSQIDNKSAPGELALPAEAD